MRDRVEIDYADRLSQAERRWLACFNESEYGGNPERVEELTGIPIDQDAKRKGWREIKRSQRDALRHGYHQIESNWSPDSEDSQIEMIDRILEIEFMTVQSVQLFILRKYTLLREADAEV